MDRVEVSSAPADEEGGGAEVESGVESEAEAEVESGVESEAEAEVESGVESEAEAGGEGGPKVVDRRRLHVDEDGPPGEGTVKEIVRKPTFVEELEKKVAVAEEKLRGHIERIDRESAEFRERQERELERRTQRARKEAVSPFLGIADDLVRATAAASGSLGDPAKSKEALESLVQGVRMIQGRFFQELASLGVKPFSSKGEKFDPERHQAVRTMTVPDKRLDGIVVEELAPGYSFGDEVIRPSTVAVGKFSASS